MVVSGAPAKEQNHAEKVCDMALDMIEAITDLKDPSTGTRRDTDVVYGTKQPSFQVPIYGYELVFTRVPW